MKANDYFKDYGPTPTAFWIAFSIVGIIWLAVLCFAVWAVAHFVMKFW